MTESLTAAIDTHAYDNASFGRLVELLVAADADGDETAALAAVSRIGARPRLLLRLDEGLRRAWWWDSGELPPAYATLVTRFDRGSRGPIAVALVSLHRYGQVRERAVRALVARPLPELMPFLLLRAADWAGQIREPARAELARALAAEPERYLLPAVPMAVKLAGRHHGRYAFDLVTAAVLAAPDEVRRRLATSPDHVQRRLAFDADLRQDRLDLDALAGLAAREGDALIRHRAARTAYERAVGDQEWPILRRLAVARSADVRALGLTGLLRLGAVHEVVAALDDPAPLVRAIGREAARRAGPGIACCGNAIW